MLCMPGVSDARSRELKDVTAAQQIDESAKCLRKFLVCRPQDQSSAALAENAEGTLPIIKTFRGISEYRIAYSDDSHAPVGDQRFDIVSTDVAASVVTIGEGKNDAAARLFGKLLNDERKRVP